jgi:hypothetical protein
MPYTASLAKSCRKNHNVRRARPWPEFLGFENITSSSHSHVIVSAIAADEIDAIADVSR